AAADASIRADWDVATDARPHEVQALFPRTVAVGIEHGTVGVLARDGTLIEVTTFRRDIETDGRHAVVTFADSIEDDLARRDFTINALAWRPATDELRDPFRGRTDLESGILRAVGEPADRFAEDYLRVLRGLRFAGGLDLEIEEATWDALQEAVAGLGRLSAERVREELTKVLADAAPSRALDLYARAGALDAWYPELAPVAEDHSRWAANLRAVDAIASPRRRLRLARWLVPIAEEGEARRERGAALLGRLRFSNADTDFVLHLLRHYLPLVGPMDAAASLRLWLAEVGPAPARDLFRLHFGAARTSDDAQHARYLLAAWRAVHGELLEHPPLRLADLAIDGSDLLELGLVQGPLVGLMLEELHAQVLEDPERNERQTLLAAARELIELGGLDRIGRGSGAGK
ncbi:MAG: CCA tRNA nucleotidyltransferase, partial [Gemmatimonadota bacterium]